MHIGMGLVCGSKIKDMINAGFDFTIFLADWHSWINNKLGGNMSKIHTCGEYFKQCFTAIGIKPESVHYVWASEIAKNIQYWEKVVRVAKSSTLQRTWRSLPVMGREMNMTDMETAWLFYPCMQTADIFEMNLDTACAGIDQRKAHMLARDAAEKLHWKKPVCIHTHLLMGLQGQQKVESQFDENASVNLQISSKMFKSIPGSCIFMHDDPEEIQSKIRKAYCPIKVAMGNPILDFAKYTVFPEMESLDVPRAPKYGGPKTFESYEDLEKEYVKGDLHPMDLKEGVSQALIEILEPVRRHFSENPEYLKKMMEMEITR